MFACRVVFLACVCVCDAGEWCNQMLKPQKIAKSRAELHAYDPPNERAPKLPFHLGSLKQIHFYLVAGRDAKPRLASLCNVLSPMDGPL